MINGVYSELLDSIFDCKSSKLASFNKEAKITAVYTNCCLNQIHPDKDSIFCKIFLKWGHKEFMMEKLNGKTSTVIEFFNSNMCCKYILHQKMCDFIYSLILAK